MRIDHYAYQRGTQVAGFGLMVQFIIGLTLLIFGWRGGDTTFVFASIYVLVGLPVWLSLIIIFHQHKLERLEALEEDELSGGKPGSTSIFELQPDEQRVAARRLALMHKWLMPSVSLVLAAFLGLMAWWMTSFMGRVGDAATERGTEFFATRYVGWGVALCLAFALLAFIFSRFVAGMAKQTAWQNLRGGAGYMVGTALLLLIVAVGLGFRVFNNDQVIWWVANWAIPIFLWIVSAEIVLLFILNLYRPRIPGEVPRPAFDSRILSLFAAPDSIVKSLNDAVNYQFGFDITSSWGYQLLLRSFVWLIAIGAISMLLLNTMVVVEPHQQAVRLRSGKIIGDVYGAGIMWKLPWPFERALIVPVGEVREVNLTARRRDRTVDNLWTVGLAETRGGLDQTMDPIIVGSTPPRELEEFEFEFLFDEEDWFDPDAGSDESDTGSELPIHGDGAEHVAYEPLQAVDEIDEATAAVSRAFALVDAEMSLHYRIRRVDDPSGKGGLLDYLHFVPDTPTRRARATSREDAIRAIALREVTQYLSSLTIDGVLSQTRGSIAEELRTRIQRSLDDRKAGIEVLAVNMPLVRPSGDSADAFEEVPGGMHARREIIARKQGEITDRLTSLVGDPATATRVLAELDELLRIEGEHGPKSAEAVEQRLNVERLLRRSGGEAAQRLANAETDRWIDLMNKRVQATRITSQAPAFDAAPRLYMEREVMRILGRHLATARKYVIGIDPSRLNIDADLKELSPLVDFSLAVSEGDSN